MLVNKNKIDLLVLSACLQNINHSIYISKKYLNSVLSSSIKNAEPDFARFYPLWPRPTKNTTSMRVYTVSKRTKYLAPSNLQVLSLTS